MGEITTAHALINVPDAAGPTCSYLDLTLVTTSYTRANVLGADQMIRVCGGGGGGDRWWWWWWGAMVFFTRANFFLLHFCPNGKNPNNICHFCTLLHSVCSL